MIQRYRVNEIRWALNCIQNIDYLSDTVKQKLVSFAKTMTSCCEAAQKKEELKQQHNLDLLETEQQKTAYQLRCNGMTAKEIAKQMNCCVRTVRRINKQVAVILGNGGNL